MIQTIPHIIDYHMYDTVSFSVALFWQYCSLFLSFRFHPSLSFVDPPVRQQNDNNTRNTYFVFIFILFDLLNNACVFVVLKLTKTGAPETFQCVSVRVRVTTISNQNRLTSMLFALASIYSFLFFQQIIYY